MSSAIATSVQPSIQGRSRSHEFPRWVVLGLCLSVIFLSMTFSLGSEPGQVMLPLLNLPLPPLCQLKTWTGIDCPGCGLTRSFVALAHGQWRDSFRLNPAGPVWFAFIALQIPYQAWQLRRVSCGKSPVDLGRWGEGFIYAALATLILQWVVRQFGWL